MDSAYSTYEPDPEGPEVRSHMGALPLSVAEIETPSAIEENGAPRSRIYLIASSGGVEVPTEVEDALGQGILDPGHEAAADLYYRDCRLMTVPTPSPGRAVIKVEIPFAGGSLDHSQFRLVGRDARSDVQGRLMIERAPQTPLERDVDEQARGLEEEHRIAPYVAFPAVAAVAAGVAVVLYFLYRAVRAVQQLVNRGSATTPIEAEFDEEARAAIRALDPHMSATELVAARRMLLRGRASGS